MTKPKKTRAANDQSAANAPQDGAQDGTAPEKARKRGRPTLYSEEIGAEICAAIANGATLTSLCEQSDFPRRETVWRWMQAHPAFEDQYLKARVFSQQMHGDEAIDIAAREEDIARARVMIEARRMVVSRLSSQYAGLIQARTPTQTPFSVAEAVEAGRKRLEALIAEVGHERAERIRQDDIIARACDPQPGVPEVLLRAEQRAATHFLEERKRKLLAMQLPTDKPI